VADHGWMLRNLRGTRATPPGLAASDRQRRAVYSAGLEQFEQLLEASKNTPPSARPLPLFYALSQAGRAIVAARGADPEIRGHGLSQDQRQPQPSELLHRRIKRTPLRNGKDAFGAVSRAINSPELHGSVEIGALWTALPGTHQVPEDAWQKSWRVALPILDETDHRAVKLGLTVVRAMSFSGNPHLTEIEALDARYPFLPETAKVQSLPGNSDMDPGNWGVTILWKTEQPLETVAPPDPSVPNESKSLLPTLPDQDAVLNPLMTWWILLFGLSVFARYEPELWIEALNVNQSPLAVPLESILQQALVAVPGLLHHELLVKAN
jgi:hypothetical protein